MSPEVTIGAALHYLRSAKNMSARKLSIDAGLSASYIGKVEQGGLEPSFRAFCAIVQALHMTDAEIIFVVKHVKG